MTRRRLGRLLVLTLAGLTLLLLLAAVGIRAYGAVRLREAERLFLREAGPLDAASYAPAPVLDERNAAPLLSGGSQAVVLGEGKDLVSRTRTQPPPTGWSEADLQELRGVLARNAAAMAVLRQARAYPEANLGIPYRQGMQAKLPNLLQAMEAAKLLAADSTLAALDGDLSHAVDDVETLGVQARAYSREPVLIVTLIGSAIERQQLAAVSRLLAAPGLDAPALERLRAASQSTDLLDVYRRSLLFEAIGIHRALRDAASLPEDAGVDLGSSFLTRLGLRVVAPLAAAESLDRARALHAAFSGTKPEIERSIASAQEKGSWLIGKWFGAIPNLKGGAIRALGTQSRRRLASAAIDLRLEALRTGRYPEALPLAHRAPEPLLGVSLRYWREPDGSAVLEVPGAGSLWKDLVPYPDGSFRWTLAPVATPR